MQYLHGAAQRSSAAPCRAGAPRTKPLHAARPRSAYADLKQGSGKQKVATTMAFVRLLKDLMKDKEIGKRWVPIIPDEARTFGMDSLFPTAKIYSPHGQKYTPVDRELFLSYKEATNGQILHEGINEAGSVGSFTAAGTCVRHPRRADDPDLHLLLDVRLPAHRRRRSGRPPTRWRAASCSAPPPGAPRSTARACSTRTATRCCIAATNPAVVAYDPAFAFEIAHIVEDGLRRMYGEQPEDIFYYLTVYNEPILQPAEPEDVDVEGLLKGIYRYAAGAATVDGPEGADPRLRHRHAVGAQGAAAARPGLGRGRRRLVGDLLDRAAPRRGRGRGAQPAAPGRASRGCRT